MALKELEPQKYTLGKENKKMLIWPTAVDARLVRGFGDHPSQVDSFEVSTWMGDRLAVC